MIYLVTTIRGFLLWLCMMPLSSCTLALGLVLGCIRLTFFLVRSDNSW